MQTKSEINVGINNKASTESLSIHLLNSSHKFLIASGVSKGDNGVNNISSYPSGYLTLI